MNFDKEQLKIFGQYFLGISLLILAISIVYFAREVAIFRAEVPQMLSSVEKTAERIDPAVQGINDFRDQIPPILEEVRKTRELVPTVLDEIAAVRKTVPDILNEIEESRKIIPPVLEEIVKTRENMPRNIETMNKSAQAIDNMAAEVKAIRPLLPEIIAEIEATRNKLDPTLARVDELIVKAGTVGKKTTEGAITGVASGVIKAPFSIFTGFGSSSSKSDKKFTGTLDFSESDLNIAKKAFYDVIDKPAGSKIDWKNPDTGMNGTITVDSSYLSAGDNCVKINNYARRNDKQVANKLFGYCKDEFGNWKLDN